jgi:uncharacterized protein YuzE
MAEIKVTYDHTANAAYIYFVDPQVIEPRVKSVARTYPCDPIAVDGMVNLDFDEADRLIGVEVLAARSKLPRYLLDAAERIDVEDA